MTKAPKALTSAGVDVFDVPRLRLVEAAPPRLSPADEAARDRAWQRAVEANPDLFDGPVAACAGVAWEGPHRLVLSWTRVTYRHYALRRVPGNRAWLPSLFVYVVQPTDDGRMLIARMSSSTSTPGRWQLPGGSVEPPQDGAELDEEALRAHAARELVEETGVDLPARQLALWAVTRGAHRSIGLAHLAPPRPAQELREAFAAMTAAERTAGRAPELDRITLVSCPAELAGLAGPHVDYLEPIVRRYTNTAR
ncbi:NUDIX domain-containing protein [Streptomyces sp. NPDC002143]